MRRDAADHASSLRHRRTNQDQSGGTHLSELVPSFPRRSLRFRSLRARRAMAASSGGGGGAGGVEADENEADVVFAEALSADEVEARKRAQAEAAGEVVELLDEAPETAAEKAKREAQARQRQADAAAAAAARLRTALRAKTDWCGCTARCCRALAAACSSEGAGLGPRALAHSAPSARPEGTPATARSRRWRQRCRRRWTRCCRARSCLLPSWLLACACPRFAYRGTVCACSPVRAVASAPTGAGRAKNTSDPAATEATR